MDSTMYHYQLIEYSVPVTATAWLIFNVVPLKPASRSPAKGVICRAAPTTSRDSPVHRSPVCDANLPGVRHVRVGGSVDGAKRPPYF